MIFSVCAITGANTLYRLAIGIAPTENFDYWKIFLTGLKEPLHLDEVPNLVIISDKKRAFKLSLMRLYLQQTIFFALFTEKKY